MADIHQKRLAIPKTWPLARKKETFIARLRPGSHEKEQAMPLTVILREMLHVANNSHEVKFLLRKNKVIVGGSRRNDHQFPVGLFEVISIGDVHHRMVLDSLGKLQCVSVDAKEANLVPAKILGKTIVKKGKVQYNLFGGRNLLLDKEKKEYNIGDTLVLDEKNAVKQHIPLKKGTLVFFTRGKFQGTTAKVEDIQGNTIVVTNQDGTSKTVTEYAYALGDKESCITLAK